MTELELRFMEKVPRMLAGEVVISPWSSDRTRRHVSTVGSGYLVRERGGVVYVALRVWPDFKCAARGKAFG